MITFWEYMKQMDEFALKSFKYKPGAVIPKIGPKAGGEGLNPFKTVKPQKIQPYKGFSTKKKKSSIVLEK